MISRNLEPKSAEFGLEEKREEIAVLAKHLLSDFAGNSGIDEDAKRTLMVYATKYLLLKLMDKIDGLDEKQSYQAMQRLLDPNTLVDQKKELAMEVLIGSADDVQETDSTASDVDYDLQRRTAQRLSHDAFGAQKKDQRNRERLLDQEGGLVTAEELARLINRATTTPRRLYRENKLLGVQTVQGKTSQRLFPRWQVSEGVLLAGLDKIKSAFSFNDMRAIRFLLLPLRGSDQPISRPLDLLRQGRLDEVLNAVSQELGNGEEGKEELQAG